MATLTLTRQFPDGDLLNISIKVDGSYPDCIDEAKAALMSVYNEAMSGVIAAEDEPPLSK